VVHVKISYDSPVFRPNPLRSSLAILACASVFGSAATPALADIYSFVDEDGTVRFTDQPNDPRYKLFLKERRTDALALRNLRTPGDARLRAPGGRDLELRAYENPLLAAKPYQEDVLEAAKEHKLDPALVHAVIAAESNYNPNAVSVKGAIGLMQVMPDTGRRYGVREKELRQPRQNIHTGARYLADLIRLFDGDVKLALASYNAGENVILRFGRQIPPYAETQAYVPRVLRFYDQLTVKQ
jgi:soluble lytic murein transglycosylase-like protein